MTTIIELFFFDKTIIAWQQLLHDNSYEAITGGLIHVAMSLLTGGIGQMIKLEQAKTLGHVTNGRLWMRMFTLHKGKMAVATDFWIMICRKLAAE